MSSRNYLLAASTLVLAAFLGNASPAAAGETKPLSPEPCGVVSRSSVGHPGKSALFPKAVMRTATECAHAAPAKRARLTLTAFEDSTGGKALVWGNAERAIKQLQVRQNFPTVENLTNLCVAHTVLRQVEEASDACDAAVSRAAEKRAKLAFRPGVSRIQLDQDAAVAYANRAVMHWLANDVAAAQRDLASARAISPNAFFVIRNADVGLNAPALAQNVVLVSRSKS